MPACARKWSSVANCCMSSIRSPARFTNETDAMFSKFTAAAGCSSSPAPLECLRAQPEEVIRQATDSVCSKSPYSLCYVPAQDGYFHGITSSESVRCGQVAAVPMIIGDRFQYTTAAYDGLIEFVPHRELP